jgi:hypothetical protein
MKTKILFFAAMGTMYFFSKVSCAQVPGYLWAKSAGSTANEAAGSIAVDGRGNTYVSGVFNGPTFIFGPDTISNAGYYDIFLAKYDANGNPIWAKSAGGTDIEVVACIKIDASQNIVIAGYFRSPTLTMDSITLTNTNTGSYDVFLAKLDSNGNALWAKQAAGTGYDMATDLAVDGAGNICIAGFFQSSTLTFGATTLTNSNAGIYEIFLAKYDANGAEQWAKSVAGSDKDEASCVAMDAQGNIFLAGHFESPVLTLDSITLTNAGWYDIFLAKLDTGGNFLWAKSAGSTGDDCARSLVTDKSGNAYLAGSFLSPSITFGADILINIYFGTADIFLAKYSPIGNVLWAKETGGNHDDEPESITLGPAGEIYMTGWFESTSIAFGATTLVNMGECDPFIAANDINGNVLWAKSTGGTAIDVAKCIDTDPWGSIYVVGYFFSTALSFDTTLLTNADPTYSTDDFFLTKLNGSILTDINNPGNLFDIAVFPNPASAYIELRIPTKSVIEILNIQSQLIRRINAPDPLTTIDISDLPEGIYFIKVKTDKEIVAKKFIKQ